MALTAAPSYEALNNTREVFEEAIAAYFSANGLPCYTSRGSEDMPDSHIEVRFDPGSSTGHQATRQHTGTFANELDGFTGNITIGVFSERVKDEASPDAAISTLHNYRVARAKVLMMRGAINGLFGGITGMVLPYYVMTVEAFSGEIDTATDAAIDSTEIGYTIQYHIRQNAWPASA